MSTMQYKIQLIISALNVKDKNLFKNFLILLLKKNNLISFQLNEISLKKNKRKFTLLKSPHVFKNARNQFELVKRTTVFEVKNYSLKEVVKLRKIFSFLVRNVPLKTAIIIKSCFKIKV